jgi:uncharacterized protein YjbI with pentapeptide repeats
MNEKLRKWIERLREWAFYAVMFAFLLAAIHLFENQPPFKGIVESLSNSKFLGTLQNLSILALVILFFKEAPDRKKREQYEAWRVINSAYGQRTSGGRIQALQDLNNDKVSLAGLTADKAYLAGINLKKADLKYANVQETNLRYANLQGSELRNANLQKADLIYADFRGANLSYANLQGEGTNLSYANLQGANLRHANLQGAYLWSANLQGADLSYANLQETDLSYANLHGAKLRHANFRRADLSPVNLQKVDFQGADLWDADLRSAENLSPEQVKLAKNWEQAKYNEAFRTKLGLPMLVTKGTEEESNVDELSVDSHSPFTADDSYPPTDLFDH